MWKTILGLGSGITSGIINDIYTERQNERNAARNQHYWNLQSEKLFEQNEIAADNALKRQYQLYNDLQSPQAMVQQLKKAGLNPALMYSMGGAGGHVSSAPQGGASSGSGAGNQLGLQNLFSVDPLTMAQIENINADTDKKKEEVKNTQQDTALKKSMELLNTQTTDQNARRFEHELGILIAQQALAENDQSMIETKNAMTNKQLEILQSDAKLKQYEEELGKAFKEKGWDLGSMTGLGSLIIQMGDKFFNLLKKWEIEIPEWMKL